MFQELLSEYRQEWPQTDLSTARAKLRKGLVALLESGNIGLYAEQWAKPETRRDIVLEGARKAVGDSINWDPPEVVDWFHYIYIVNDWAPI